jgi:RNA polymerase sigma-70 factor (ECF subfamily)
MIHTAVRRLARAAGHDRPGPYQLEAAIAAQHALAPSYEQTDWAALRTLYDHLRIMRPSPVVLLGRAVATGYVEGPAAALAEVELLADRLVGYRLWHATRADLLHRLGRETEAIEATRQALALATNPAERDLLARRLDALLAIPRSTP